MESEEVQGKVIYFPRDKRLPVDVLKLHILIIRTMRLYVERIALLKK